MKKVLLLICALVLTVALFLGSTLIATGAPSEGSGQSTLNTDYFSISDPGGGAQPPMTYTDSQTHVTPAGILSICLQDVGTNPAPVPPSWADDICNIYVDGVYVGTYDSLNNPLPAPPGPVQCFSTSVPAGSHVILVEAVYSWVAGSAWAKEIGMSFVEVDIDIKPWSDPNSINTKSKGVVPVAILGSAFFDVTTVDVTTVVFGPDDATAKHDLTDPVTYADHYVMPYLYDPDGIPGSGDEYMRTANMDLIPDLVFHFPQRATGLAVGDTDACLSGQLTDGTPFSGCDAVRIVK